MIVTLDTTRRDCMGFLGMVPSPTPALDALATESVVFTDAYTVAPLTLPAHTSLMTGLHPQSHRVRENSLAAVPPEAMTLAEVLHEAGFATGAAVAAAVLDASFGLDQGFTTYRNPPRAPGATEMTMAEVRGDAMVDRALADISALPLANGRFFYWLHLFDAHFPYAAPGSQPRPVVDEPSQRAEARRLYLEEIRFQDAQLGRLLAALRARSDFDALTLVIAADHGESLFDGRESTHGYFLYDPTVRIPLLVKTPGAAARRVATQVSLVDVMPTLLDLLGVPRPDLAFDGGDLAPLVRGGEADADSRVVAFETWHAFANFGWAPLEGCVQGAIKVVRSRTTELFDRADDPREEKNLFTPDEPRARSLLRRLDDFLSQPAASLAPSTSRPDAAARAGVAALGYVEAQPVDLAARPDFAHLDDARDHLGTILKVEAVNTAWAERRLGDAIRLARELCSEVPGSAYLHEELASFLLMERRPELLAEAADQLKQALAISGSRSSSWFNLGLIALRRMGAAEQRGDRGEADTRRGEAIAAFRRTLTIDATSPQALANLASLLRMEADRIPATAPDPAETRTALLKEVAALFGRFLEVVPPDHPDRAKITAALEEARRQLATGGK